MLQGKMTYAGIIGLILVSLFGKYLSRDEADQIAVLIVTVASGAIALYGRYRIVRARY